MGAHFEALDEGVLLVPLDTRYTQVGFNLISVQAQWHKTSELLLLSGDLPSLQVHYSSHLSPSQTILIETVSGTHNEQPLNGLVTAMHSHDWKSTFKVTTQVMHFHFIKKIVPEWAVRLWPNR